MKVLLVYPMIDCPAGTNHGIMALSGCLKARGHEVELLHVCEKLWPIPTAEEVIEVVRRARPGLIGFSALSQQYEWCCETSRAVRRAFPEIPQCVGGVHCTMVPDEVTADAVFEYVCVGEGDYAFAELASRIERGEDTTSIPNIRVTARGGRAEAIVNKVSPFPDLASLPPLDWEIFDIERVLQVTRGWLGMLTSRGCPYKCTYCFNYEIVDLYQQEGGARSVKDFLRHFPIPRIMDEIRALKTRYPQIRTIIFDDDLFTLNREYVRRFCEAYREAGFDLPFVVNAHVNCFDDAMARQLSEAGCRIVKYGLESGSPRVRKEVLLRPMTNDQIRRSFEAAHRYDLHTSAFIMIGLPHETEEEIRETLRLCAEVKMGRFRWAIFFPFPGTAAYSIAKEADLIDYEKMKRLGNYFDGSCLRFGEAHDLFISKVGKLCNWWVNAYSDWPSSPIYRKLVSEVEAMDRETWERRKDELVQYDRELSEELIEKDITHYSIRYAHVMGVRSDFIRWEREQLRRRPGMEKVVYTLD